MIPSPFRTALLTLAIYVFLTPAFAAGPKQHVATPISQPAVAPAVVAPMPAPVPAPTEPKLRGDVTVNRDVLTLADLVEGVTGPLADKPLFRAPTLGETGTIQAHRIIEAAGDLGFAPVDTGGRRQVTISGSARRIGPAEMEAAVKQALELQQLDSRNLSVTFDGPAPALLVAPEVGDPVAAEAVFDRRSRRVSALVWVGPSPTERRASLRISGSVAELVEVGVLNRSLARGDAVQAGDIMVERKPREVVPADVQSDAADLVGRTARRALAAGSVIRIGDLAKPELVGRGDLVTVVYEAPGLVLTLRARASEAGAAGDTITVLNPQSKKVLQATVVGPGRVSVSAALPGPLASNAVPRPAQP